MTPTIQGRFQKIDGRLLMIYWKLMNNW